jgi:hypothetical protein
MTKPDTPFPRHWLYYIVLKYGVIAAAIALALYVGYLMEFQRHHIVFGVIALVVAAALAANYYLW